MFLRPQHFQQQDRHFQNWVELRSGGMGCYYWGLSKLEIDSQLLALGKFALVSIAGVFPDGTPFNAPGDHPPPQVLEIPVESKDELILLSLPLRRQEGQQVGRGNADDQLCRYRLVEMELNDYHTEKSSGQAAVEQGALWPRLRLASQDQGPFATIPVARVKERKANGEVVLDEAFIVTNYNCPASGNLSAYLREIEGMLHHRSQQLAERISTAGSGGVAEIVDFILLQIVNRYQPLFSHLVDLKGLHPEALYRTLLQLAGELATITEETRRPDSFPYYDHRDQAASFQPVIAAVRRSLNWAGDPRAIAIPLEKHPKYAIYTGKIYDPELIKEAGFILTASAKLPAEEIRTRLPSNVTIAPKDQLSELVNRHIPGIPLVPLATEPRQIPYHAGRTYFELDKSNPLWEALANGGVLAMHFAGDYPGLKLEFWAIRR